VNRLDALRREIIEDASNAWARELGYQPLYAAQPGARVAIIGQAPGLRAQSGGLVWDDPSGVTLRSWLGVSEEQFYDPDVFALLPMDFYYPGKAINGKSGDLPPRQDFAPRWHPRILAELPRIHLTLLVGSYAQAHYLAGRAKRTLTENVRAYAEYLPSTMALVHPSPLNFRWQAKNPWFAAEVVPALRAAVRTSVDEA